MAEEKKTEKVDPEKLKQSVEAARAILEKLPAGLGTPVLTCVICQNQII